jgi:hypothetical protein
LIFIKKYVIIYIENKKGNKVMPANIGYLTAKTDKASDEVYTPVYAV